ncbi:chemotaxis protein CheA [Azospirillum brasilense]|uniref:Chemotaxis protein CheA n=1 Tax=Azospirillum brasilense TaxID=192 RepID=A0A0P0FBY9_AZOBR|nr:MULTISPECIES: chemotaxis protein CheA [Azospirillum]ALJ38472.1 histidine kinase [Azospirillum brasilense]MDW7553123.1 chemotaxis protein CheA [Azospirillum brasilense]MDW7593499.1 chemotaxis protein CheA [Azospirillum brasilense]MDW7628442.1 chemotaxis protein CheA [Azospirillum brasilense]MDX5955463.1 chemotaxis protein CheA [Azospirillum brasilense]
MSALFEQFVLESRELLEAAGAALLRLERDPTETAAVNDLFRALHTLKGATALFDMAPFTRMVHAGEDALMAVRDGRAAMSGDLADRLLELLDTGAAWVDGLEFSQSLPDDADTRARAQEAGLRAALGDSAETADGGAPAGFAWVDELPEAERAKAAGRTVTAIAYDPAEDCFFAGDDPLDLCRRIPDLLLLRVEAAGAWPPLTDLDPYRCALRFRALSGASKDELARLFRGVPDQLSLATVAIPAQAAPASLATAMLREQARILGLPGSDAETAARRPAVLRAVRNILAAEGRNAEAPPLDRAADGPADALIRCIEGLAEAAPAAPAASPLQARRTLRVDAERMDRLMALVGELVVAKGSLPYLAREAQHGRSADALAQGIKEAHGRIDSIVGDLQDAVLRLRLLPLSRVFDPLPRLVRDTARRLGKPVELHLSGGETEADKDILDILGEPLLHLVRNGLDHGIEAPERRRAAGKPEVAAIRVQAFQDSGGVVVEVSDDGAGIDAEAVRRKAVAAGALTAEQAAALNEAEALRLIFLPGLSTSAMVSDLSGRGVGMDAVRGAVEQAGGRVEVASTPGAGTRFRLVLPLTMMVTRLVMVETAGALYGFPVTLVTGMQRVPHGAIRRMKHAESVVVQDTVVPLLRLRRLLNLPEDERERSGEAVLLVDLGGQPVGLVVDAFRERAEVVLKPMTGLLARLRGYAGTAVLGDGSLLLALNLRELM